MSITCELPSLDIPSLCEYEQLIRGFRVELHDPFLEPLGVDETIGLWLGSWSKRHFLGVVGVERVDEGECLVELLTDRWRIGPLIMIMIRVSLYIVSWARWERGGCSFA